MVAVCKSGFFNSVHHLYFNKITTFRNLLPENQLNQGAQQLGFLSFLFTCRRKKIQLPKRSNFIKIQTMDKVQKKHFCKDLTLS
jgi:hypothetical protein